MTLNIAETDIPVLTEFGQAADPSQYLALPDDWQIGVADIVDSSSAIASGEYKSVNFAGAATISAVTNALGEKLQLFSFGGDGAHFVVRPDQISVASTALDQVANWVSKELGFQMRVGMISIADVRRAGFEVQAAFWQASKDVRYALFTGGGLEWAESQLKKGKLALDSGASQGDPDLTGLSCQWGPVRPSRGKVISLIVKPLEAGSRQFDQFTRDIVAGLTRAGAVNPVPQAGPDIRWPSDSMKLQSHTKLSSVGSIARWARTLAETVFFWVVFKTSAPVGGFKPDQYRAEIAANIDYQKFNDGLMMTLDCSVDSIAALRSQLETAAEEGIIKFGLHVQDEALITCVVSSVFDSSHIHFIDGSDGGYATAMQHLRNQENSSDI
ncbi:MAG: DUF3095 domain-containing protein [Rhizobiaceae bacterium]